MANVSLKKNKEKTSAQLQEINTYVEGTLYFTKDQEILLDDSNSSRRKYGITVEQKEPSTSDGTTNVTYPILFSNQTEPTNGEAYGTYYDKLITINPSDNTLSASTFIGDLTGNVTGNVTGDISGNAGSATVLATARSIDGVSFDGSKNIIHYAICSTSATAQEKIVDIEDFSLTTGAKVLVKFTNANTASSPKLNVNSTGAKTIYFRNAILSSIYYWSSNTVLEFIYDGSRWEMVNTSKDTMVYQSALTDQDSNKYALLTRAKDVNAGNEIDTIKYKNTLCFQPSTNRLTAGGLTLTDGHLFLGGVEANSSTSNTTQIIFGPESDSKENDHIALSSNNDMLILNPNREDTSSQILLSINTMSEFPNGIESTIGFKGPLDGNAKSASTITQSAIISSEYSNYRSLVWGPCNSPSEAFSPITTTGNLFASSELYCQPSTGMLHAKILKATGSIELDDGTTKSTTSILSGSSLSMSGNDKSLNLNLKDGYFGAEDTSNKTASLLNSTSLMFSKDNSGTITSATITYDSTDNMLETNAYFSAARVYGAVFNDYAEYRESKEYKPGLCLIEKGNGELIPSTQRLQPGANIISDTFGFAIGETDKCKTPLAIAGRVLAYPYENKEEYKPGDAVCSGPDGTISKMTREEIREYPERIIGTVSEIPEYKTWGTNNIWVDGRIWIKVK